MKRSRAAALGETRAVPWRREVVVCDPRPGVRSAAPSMAEAGRPRNCEWAASRARFQAAYSKKLADATRNVRPVGVDEQVLRFRLDPYCWIVG